MHSVLVPLVLGVEIGSTAVGAVGGLVTAVGVVVMCWIALAPLASEGWAESFGVEAVGAPGPDPVEVVDGRAEPVPASEGDVAIEPDVEETSEPATPTPAAAE